MSYYDDYNLCYVASLDGKTEQYGLVDKNKAIVGTDIDEIKAINSDETILTILGPWHIQQVFYPGGRE